MRELRDLFTPMIMRSVEVYARRKVPAAIAIGRCDQLHFFSFFFLDPPPIPDHRVIQICLKYSATNVVLGTFLPRENGAYL